MVIKNRSKICLIISGAIIAVALFLTIIGHGINLGIDFEGGLSMQYDMKTAVTRADVESVLSGLNVGSFTVTVQGANNSEVNIRIKDVAKEDIQNVQDNFEAGITQGAGNDFGAAVVAVETRFSNQDADLLFAHLEFPPYSIAAATYSPNSSLSTWQISPRVA